MRAHSIHLGGLDRSPHPHPGDLEQEVMLTTKTPKATVGGLSPSKGYTLQIFELTGSGNVLLAQREFVSKSLRGCMCAEEAGAEPWQPLDWEPQGAWMNRRGEGCVQPQASLPSLVILTAPRISLQSKI